MKKYRIEDSHFLQYATRYEIVEGMEGVRANDASAWIGIGNNMFKIQIKTTFNYWFADYTSFSKFVDLLSEEGYTYVRAIHNAYTDGRGNVVIGGYPLENEYITPTRFYKGLNENGKPRIIKGFRKGIPTSTESGKSRAWIITGIIHYSGNGNEWVDTGYLAGVGRGGKYLAPGVGYASMITEDAAKQYIRKHPENAKYAQLKAISMIDYLTNSTIRI